MVQGSPFSSYGFPILFFIIFFLLQGPQISECIFVFSQFNIRYYILLLIRSVSTGVLTGLLSIDDEENGIKSGQVRSILTNWASIHLGNKKM